MKNKSAKYRNKNIISHKLPNPVNVKDPHTDGYTVAVCPCQNIKLTLTNPVNVFKEASIEDSWDVKVYSDYFYLDHTVDNNLGYKQYNFIQYYDLKSWTDYSSVYLGDIEITVNSKTSPQETFSLCVVARSVGKQSRIITAINPVVNKLKVDLDEILEVIVTKDEISPPNEEVWCSLYDMGRSGTNGSQWFERLRQETIILPNQSPMPVDPSNLYLTLSRSISSLPRNPGLPKTKDLPAVSAKEIQSQHHFWFRVKPEDKESVLKSNTGLPMANIVFNGTSGTCSNLQILVCTRGTRSVDSDIDEYDKDSYEGKYRGLIGRQYYQSIGLLVNPGKIENAIELTPSQNGLVVELSPLQMTWPYTDPKYRWQFEVESVTGTTTDNIPFVKRIKCITLPDRKINQHIIQRFLIKPDCELPNNEEMLYLGVVSFSCKEQTIVEKRSINCWLVQRSTAINEHDDNAGNTRYKSLVIPSSQKKHGLVRIGGDNHQKSQHTKTLALPAFSTPAKQERTVVSITEICDDTIMFPGVVTIPFQNIKYDFDGLNKKKSKITNTNIHQLNIIKKNQNESTKKSPVNSLNLPQVNKEKENESVTNGNICYISDPEEHTLATVKYGQILVIRLPIENWQMNDDIGNFWIINLIQIKNNQFFIKSQNFVRDGRQLYQEIAISLLVRNGPNEIGTFLIGGIECSNQHEVKYIAIELVVEKLGSNETNPYYHKLLRGLMDSVKATRDTKKVAEKQDASIALTDEQRQQLCRWREEESKYLLTNKEKHSSSKCVALRNPLNGHSVVLNCNDTLRITFPQKITTVETHNSSYVLSAPWVCCGHPKWIYIAETIASNGEKSFIFKINKDVKNPQPDEVQFKNDTHVRIIRVSCNFQESAILAIGS